MSSKVASNLDLSTPLTIDRMPPTSRIWVFTCNNECKPTWDPVNMVYLAFQREVAPSTERLHWQGCVKMKTPCRLPKVRSTIGCMTAHFEASRSWDSAKEYVKKPETAVPGTYEEHGQDSTQGQRTDLHELTNRVRNGHSMLQIAEADPIVFIKYHRGIQALRQVTQQARSGPRCVMLLHGLTGVGKTRFAYDRFPDLYPVFDIVNPWFDGYDSQRCALLDECGPGMMSFNFLKRITDRYPVQVPVKGGAAPWNPDVVILTSNADLSTWYQNIPLADREALTRRIRSFHFPDEEAAAHSYLLTFVPEVVVAPPQLPAPLAPADRAAPIDLHSCPDLDRDITWILDSD